MPGKGGRASWECHDSLVWSNGGLGDSLKKTAEPSTARHPTSNSTNPGAGIQRIEMYPVVIRSAVHAATRCALAITTLHPRLNLRNLAFEEGKEHGTLQGACVKVGTSGTPSDTDFLWREAC